MRRNLLNPMTVRSGPVEVMSIETLRGLVKDMDEYAQALLHEILKIELVEVDGRKMLRRGFDLPTEGKKPAVDALSIASTVLGELQYQDRRAVLAYVVAMYGDNKS